MDGMAAQMKGEAHSRMQQEMAEQQQYDQVSQRQTMIEQAVARNVMTSLQMVEDKMDTDIKKLDDMENMNESALDEVRDRRREQARHMADQRHKWRAQGHGEYTEVRGEKEFFAECRRSERVVVHFYRSSCISCQLVDKHLSEISRSNMETRFFKVDAEKSPFLVERLNIWMMPSIVIIKNGKTEHTIVGLDEFGGDEEFSTEMVKYVMGTHGAINHDGRPPENANSEKKVVSRFMKTEKTVRQGENGSTLDEDADWWD